VPVQAQVPGRPRAAAPAPAPGRIPEQASELERLLPGLVSLRASMRVVFPVQVLVMVQ
jgi:hypothetical protein